MRWMLAGFSWGLAWLRSRRLGVVAQDEAGDAVARGTIGELIAGKPPRVLELRAVHAHLAAGIVGHEAQHDLARKRPVLGAHVADVLHVDAELFLELAGHRALQRLAVVDEARHEGVAPRCPLRLAREEDAVAVADENDDGGMEMGVVLVAAARAALAPFALDACGRLAAPRAEAARGLPPERLPGHAPERQQVVGQFRAAHGH